MAKSPTAFSGPPVPVRNNPKKLLVEGKYDQFVTAEFMKKFVEWGGRGQEVVDIVPAGSVDELLNPIFINIYLKDPSTKALGIIVDADDRREARWESVCQLCRGVLKDFPAVLPITGLIYDAPSGLRVGVWVMPDNQTDGMLETFLSHLIPTGQDLLWEFARRSRAEARSHGATYSDAHQIKAAIHTYLAWIDPPGQQLHTAVMTKSFDARTPLGLSFARWFVALFGLPPRDPAVFAAAP